MVLVQGAVIGVLGFTLLEILGTKIYGVDPFPWQAVIVHSLLGAVVGFDRWVPVPQAHPGRGRPEGSQ